MQNQSRKKKKPTKRTLYDLASIPLSSMRGVGPRRASLLSDAGLKTVRDLLYHLPFRYEDRTRTPALEELQNPRRRADFPPGSFVTISAAVVSSDVKKTGPPKRGGRYRRGGGGGGLEILEVLVTDGGGGSMKAKWFNRSWLRYQFKPGRQVILSGKVVPAFREAGLELENPDFEFPSGPSGGPGEGEEGGGGGNLHARGIVPVHHSVSKIGPTFMRALISEALETWLEGLVDPMPPEILERHSLPTLEEALRLVHFPPEPEVPEAAGEYLHALNAGESPWRRRLVFDEFFMLEAGLAVIRAQRRDRRGIAFKDKGGLRNRLLDSLPFGLTRAQQRAVGEITGEMKSPRPMNRLLQGDVGSGKTLVALMAMLMAAENGYQSALMAPTEVLALQHGRTLEKLLSPLGLEAALITASSKDRRLAEVESGGIPIIVGTHALIEEGVRFNNLGLVIIDEQHRFGVRQRAELRRKAGNPDMLLMTATPIPRTLSLTLYGDLDVSVLDELPPGRTPVRTRLLDEGSRREAYGEIEKEVAEGGQVYVVYPVIEESEKSDLRAASEGAERLAGRFPSLRTGLVHGRMKAAEREENMALFEAGKLDILVSTTVIEVGVDVPNASLMIIVHAERFGLAQLHQLRGRVGRGPRPSRCLLLAYGNPGEEATRRLTAMASTNDGFRIAEEDLAIRGPGDLAGRKQSGLPDLAVADIIKDAHTLKPAREEAFSLISEDPQASSHPLLKNELERFWHNRLDLFRTG